MSTKTWSVSQNAWFRRDRSNDSEKLENAIYTVQMIPMTGEIFLEKVSECFEFGHKIYGTETSFIDRVIKSFKHATSNLGILLNGIKGTGKTVTAKMICNKLQIPVILVGMNPGHGFIDFLASIDQDVIILFDEFEKTFNKIEDQQMLLTIMDGVFNSADHKRLFIMTTNQQKVDDNFLERPSRIRYIKSYGDLDLATIEEIVDDMLVHKELRGKCIDFISTMRIITVDLVKSVLNEVNLHGEAPQTFASYFNVKEATPSVNVYLVDKEGKETLIHEEMQNYHFRPQPGEDGYNAEWEGEDITIYNRYIGDIEKVLSKDTIQVSVLEDTIKGRSENKRITQVWRIEKTKTRHSSFTSSYNFSF